MTVDMADDMLVDSASDSAAEQISSKDLVDHEQTTRDIHQRPSTPPLPSADDEMASIQIPDEAALAAAAAAAMAAAAHASEGLERQQQQQQQQHTLHDGADRTDDLDSYLVAAAAASVHAQQQQISHASEEDLLRGSSNPATTPLTTQTHINGTSADTSVMTGARAALHDQCRRYSDDQTPFPLSIGKRTLAGRPASSRDSVPPQLEPRVELGKTRCYWALLSADYSKGNGPTGDKLQFVYLDPVLQQHLDQQSASMVGSDFYDYVHPEERDRVIDDMQRIVESRTLFGSVTRCRYSRIPHIRELLGAINPPRDPEADRYVEDDSFVAIDIIINWIGDGMLLCFFHAIIDKAAEDNDEQNKSDWTNWCGTPTGSFTQHQCDTIWKQVKATPREAFSASGPDHVFQVIEAGEDSKVLLSWPPPRLFSSDVDADVLARSDTTAFEDGSYFADDFARLARGVSIAPGSSSLSDANTSCTRRFRAKHTLTTEGKVRSIESVLIPYGGVILACFHTTFQQALPPPDSELVSQAQTERRKAEDAGAGHSPSKRQRTENEGVSEGPANAGSNLSKLPTHTQPKTVAPVPSSAASPTAKPQDRFYALHDGHAGQSNGHSSKAANGNTPRPAVSQHQRPAIKSEGGGINLYTNAPVKAPATPTNTVRPAPERKSSTPVQKAANGHANGVSPASPSAAPTGDYAPGSDKACTGCGKVNSPEWRRGPSGHKTLCNACGLRYARSLTRRKKKKGKDGEVEFIEPTGDPTIVPKSRGGGGGSLPGVHRKNSKKRKEEEAAKAAAAAAVAASTGTPNAVVVPSATTSSSSASPLSASATQSPAVGATPVAKSASPAKAEEVEVAMPAPGPVLGKSESDEASDKKAEAANGAVGNEGSSTPAPAATGSTDPAHSIAVSIALDAIAQASASAPLLDADSLSLPVSDAISRAIAATIGSTNGSAAVDGGLLTSQSLSSSGPTDDTSAAAGGESQTTTDLDPAVSAAALQTIESVVSETLYKQLVHSSLPETPPADADKDSAGGGLTDALTADAIRAAAQAAVAHGVADE
ncbi:hypothetical protein PHSY_006649 [Pseudozyma hubeiensis SY62]|uniref:GATA-type domain-containing protein n=1 Tax=Pseudozyma hubeiensis (strain SY62) TaxID=1305764 RepID=R9PCT1_PSEHS|nr:hypothetical protein PHSY_006649 [Pseudozyma hubeiensis SY62]GAC99052.1 hypothetical protein PHSY_006649 [Pseudozyma hubeiensis SY62]